MIKKKIGSFCIVLTILLNILGVTPFLTVASAENQYITADWIVGGGVYFDEATGIISNADKTVTSIYVPSVINNVVVTAIDDYAFWACENLTTVSLSTGMTKIGDRAFASCPKLALVSIPSTVTSIGTSAFFECISLKSIEIPKSVTTIGFSAFSGCTSLTSFTIPSSVTEISSSLFSGCTNLSSVTINGSVTKINYEAFSNCSSLKNVYFTGTQNQWNNVSVGSRNTELTNATVSFNVANSENDVKYTFSNILSNGEQSIVTSITDVVAEVNSGEITAIYDLSEGIYYVVTNNLGEINGAIVRTVLRNGEQTHISDEFASVLATQSELTSTVNQYLSTSNIVLDFEKIPELVNGTEETVSSYLQNALANINGIKINDVAKGEITNFVEVAVTNQSAVSVSATDNEIVIDPEVITQSINVATKTKHDVENMLANVGEVLNKNISINTILVVKNTKLAEESDIKITINSDMKDVLNGAYMQVLLEDGKYVFSTTGENLNDILDANGTVTFKLNLNGEDIYLCEFFDGNEEVILQIASPVTIMLPTNNEFATVIASFSGTDDNWGGQYDAINNVISFQTTYSGKYMIVDNSVEINDIDDKYRAELLFMASKGFFELDFSGNFRPDENLTRYEFTKALVRMFFALNTTYETSFTDVPITSEYYSFVASAEAWNIVSGYDNGEFWGNHDITTEQVLMLIARTLADKKGYVYPDNEDEYLGWIFGTETANSWATTQMALAIREGIVLPGEVIESLSPITRQDAAVYLYRLFMLLEEVNSTTFDILTSAPSGNGDVSGNSGLTEDTSNQNSGSSVNMVLVVGLLITVTAMGIAISAFFILRRLEEIRLIKEHEEKEREKAEKARATQDLSQFTFKR